MDQVSADRYQRQTVLPDFGIEGQERLARSKVLVVGAGGLGVPVLQYLTGMGVGTIGLIDADKVSLSNLHRQVLYTESDIGLSKVSVAVNRLRQLNSSTQFQSYDQMLTGNNASSLFSSYDLIVDCTDDIGTRYLINDTCVHLNLPFVYGALYRHEGQVSVFNFKGSPTYRDAFPDDTVLAENCNEIGVLGALPGIIGTYQAMETIKVLTGFGESLAGKLLIVDAARMEHNVFIVSHSSQKGKKNLPKLENHFITWNELLSIDESTCHFIDIRESKLFEQEHDDRFENIPLNMLAGFAPNKSTVVLVCQHGKSSKQAAAILKMSYSDLKIVQIEGGYNAL
jgi:molybdopterin/thiamine biosynthesis adenylyltransferase/rhodanese-related sulfurtransferase